MFNSHRSLYSPSFVSLLLLELDVILSDFQTPNIPDSLHLDCFGDLYHLCFFQLQVGPR